MTEDGDYVFVLLSNAFDEAVVNEQSAGAQLQSARFATRCIQNCHRDGCFTAVPNATLCSQFSAYITSEFWVSIYVQETRMLYAI